MGCNSRTSYWNFPDQEQESILNFSHNVCFGSPNAEDNCEGKLKLGRSGDSNNFVDRLKYPMASASSSGSYKRPRGHGIAMQVPSCLVDGCVSDLSNCRDYHKRHKVCEAHSKTPLVTIEGQEQRFCQQCSRFHSLGEFDDSKRSCRKRLDGHNRRRRKPQSDALYMNSSKYIPTHQGSEFISYGTQYLPNSALKTSSWNDAVKAQNSHIYSPNSELNVKTINFSSSFSQGYRGEKQFPFLQSIPDKSVHLSGSNSSQKMLFPEGFDRVINSDRASSLLSSPHTDPCGFNNPAHYVQHPTQSPVANTSYYNNVAADNGGSNSNSNIDCPGTIQNSSDACQQTISFSWR